jgi:hypothetical protein
MSNESLSGFYVLVTDSLCDGWMADQEDGYIHLYLSDQKAQDEIRDWAKAKLASHKEEYPKGDEDRYMETIADAIEDTEADAIPVEEHLEGRKAIFGSEGGGIIGNKPEGKFIVCGEEEGSPYSLRKLESWDELTALKEEIDGKEG